MKNRIVLFCLAIYLLPNLAEAQLLKKLKEKIENAAESTILRKTEEKTEKTVENAFDSLATLPRKTKKGTDNSSSPEHPTSDNPSTINEKAKRQFYTNDLIVTTSEGGLAGTTIYFDADALAMRSENPKEENPIFIDSEAYNYGYNRSNKRWEKTGLLKNNAMSSMLPMMAIGLVKLPSEPMMQAIELAKQNGLSLNTFQMVEWAFIYKPEHFRNSGYEEVDFNGRTRFNYNIPDYQGSYVVFDNNGRLGKILMLINTAEGTKQGEYHFNYTETSVTLPDAVEVKMPFQDLFMPGADALPPGSDFEDQSEVPSGTNMPRSSTAEQTNPSFSPLATPDSPKVVTAEYLERFPGISAIMEAGSEKVTFYYDTKSQLMQVISAKNKTPPMYFDGNEHIYIVQDGQCIQAKFDLNMMFDQLVDGLQGENLPPDMDPVKIREAYYTTKYGIDMTIRKFPIAEWPEYITPEYFQDDTLYEKASSAGNTTYTALTGDAKGSVITFDPKNRLKEIRSKTDVGGTVVYEYPPITVELPKGSCQYIDMNQDVIARLFRK